MVRGSVWLLLGTAQLTAAADPFSRKMPAEQRVGHALARLTFGERPADRARVERQGLDAWIESQLRPESITENAALTARLKPLPARPATASLRGDRESYRQYAGALNRQIVEEKILRAVYSERQLAEVLTDFWFNHFNVHTEKGLDRIFVASYERDAIRPHVLGKFEDLLTAVARHPAMLFYLDNWQSVTPAAASIGRRNGRFRGINENYARELLELHTLGVDGGYTEQDVREVARCFTGWTIADARTGAAGFRFVTRFHDDGEKRVLGQAIPAGGGVRDGERILTLVARHPSTARFISFKLAQRFVADDPPPALVSSMAAVFEKSGGDLRAVLQHLFRSKQFWSVGAYQAKVRSPLETVAAALRATGAQVAQPLPLARIIAEMGQPLYRKAEPTGYPERGAEWLNTAGLMARLNFATELTANRIRGVTVEVTDRTVAAQQLGSPEFQKR